MEEVSYSEMPEHLTSTRCKYPHKDHHLNMIVIITLISILYVTVPTSCGPMLNTTCMLFFFMLILHATLSVQVRSRRREVTA